MKDSFFLPCEHLTLVVMRNPKVSSETSVRKHFETDEDVTKSCVYLNISCTTPFVHLKKTNRKLNRLPDVIGERLCWPSRWARLLSLDF